MYPSPRQPYFGTFVESSVKGLKDNGINFAGIVAITSKGRNRLEKALKYLSLFIRLIYYFLFKKYDLVYIHFLGLHAQFCLGISFLFPHKKIVVNIHGSDLLGVKSAIIHSRWKYLLMQKSQMIVVPSKYFKECIRVKYPELLEKIFVSPSSGIDRNVFFPNANINQKGDTLNIGFVGRIIADKGWKVLLNAFHEFVKTDTECRLFYVGSGDDENLLKEEVHRLKLEEKVIIMGGVPHHDLGNFFRMLDLFVFPTLFYESLGLVALESMACGVPVIASNRGGINDYLVDGFNGFLFEPGNVRFLIEKLRKFDSLSEVQRGQIIQNAIETALKYDSVSVNSQLSKKLLEIVG